MEFDRITEWARNQFKQFRELAAAVRAHWDKSSEARAHDHMTSTNGTLTHAGTLQRFRVFCSC